jgi:hypothetical protein
MSEKSKDSPHDVAPQPQMRRILTLWDLVLYGVVVIQPVAPMSIFGVLSERGQGHVVTAILIALVDEKNRVPRNNVIFIGGVTVVGSFLLSYGLGAETLNFGALIAFMGVNAAAFLRYYVRAETKKLGFLIPPVLGFLICLALWLNLSRPAMILGGIWISVGIAFGIWKTHWFRKPLSFDVPKE